MYLDWIDKQEALFAAKLSQSETQIEAEHTASSLPRSYSTHNAQEESIIRLVNQYQKDFRGIYSNRRDLFLLPKNEFGVEKFLCSYIKPTRLPYADLQDYRSISKFTAEIIKYQPLDKAYDPVTLT